MNRRSGTSEVVYSPARVRDNASSYTLFGAQKNDCESMFEDDAVTQGMLAFPEQIVAVLNTSTGHVHVGEAEKAGAMLFDRQAITPEIQQWIESTEESNPLSKVATEPMDEVSALHFERPLGGALIMGGHQLGSEAKVLLRMLSATLYGGRRRFRAAITAGHGQKANSCISSVSGDLNDVFLFDTELGESECITISVFKNRSHGLKRQTKRLFNTVFGDGKEAASSSEKLLGLLELSFVVSPKTNVSGTYYIHGDGKRVGEITIQAVVKAIKQRPVGEEPQAATASYLSVLLEDNGAMVWRRHWAALDKTKGGMQFFDFATRKKKVFYWDLTAVVSVERLDRSTYAIDNVFKIVFPDREPGVIYADNQETVMRWISSFKRNLWGQKG
eukprot:GHVN01070797.1.p3 GENE.GHVN01070797.1~~GHVN01070797.1.p3  ORF type:complete len:387 (+),score=51.83 GHVN01070797.1:1996-3156(+)